MYKGETVTWLIQIVANVIESQTLIKHSFD